jgi:thymidylate synthase
MYHFFTAITFLTMSPSAEELGPASGPNVVLEPKKTAESTPNPKSSPNHEEHQYLDLIRDILENGEHRPDRSEL